MNRIKAPCHCCGHSVELFRDHISGPEHYRCGNCFEVFDSDEVDRLEKLAAELRHHEEERHAILAAHGFDRR